MSGMEKLRQSSFAFVEIRQVILYICKVLKNGLNFRLLVLKCQRQFEIYQRVENFR